ncbi:hypothetical protein HDV00_007756 [Rhizophlyctis rosea]|nr:hypothetical protein HDV00_007756 [Rhizophlyctis rosea]
MHILTAFSLAALALPLAANAAPTVDTRFPYNGPITPVGDWVNNAVQSNGKGFPRLVEPPAVTPRKENPKNNVNVIQLSYIPEGINIHYQTPFGLGQRPTIEWGTSKRNLGHVAIGETSTYDRTPPCSEIAVTQCSQFFHDVQIKNLKPGTKYYYRIPAANGTTESDVLSFTTALQPGNKKSFSLAVLNDMGYTNAGGTYKNLVKAVNDGTVFAWHGGDISYADDWYSGILPCEDDWPVCYDGSRTRLPGAAPVPDEYKNTPLPAGEVPNQGGPQGGDMSVIYESNWDLWQQWMGKISAQVPYMVLPGNHEASCAEFDGGNGTLSAYLNHNQPNSHSKDYLTYYSCPESQRNFTAFQHRFRMPGEETGGKGNFWYSFEYGLAHFISINGETDFAKSPEWPFHSDLKGNQTFPNATQTYPTDSGPFGDVGNYADSKTYEQLKWLEADLQKIDRKKTPWVIAMSHRPMYSTQVSSYQTNIRNAFEALLLKYNVDVYLSGHIHWYERLYPMSANSTIDAHAIIDQHTYVSTNTSMVHIINGMAGNIESHSTIGATTKIQPYTAVLNQHNFGFSKLTVVDEYKLKWEFIKGEDGKVGDYVVIQKPDAKTSSPWIFWK